MKAWSVKRLSGNLDSSTDCLLWGPGGIEHEHFIRHSVTGTSVQLSESHDDTALQYSSQSLMTIPEPE